MSCLFFKTAIASWMTTLIAIVAPVYSATILEVHHVYGQIIIGYIQLCYGSQNYNALEESTNHVLAFSFECL